MGRDRLNTVPAERPPENRRQFLRAAAFAGSSPATARAAARGPSDPANPAELAHWADGEATQFWTAQAGVPGEYLVASNYASPDDSEPVGLFVFPDPTDNPATVTPSGPPVEVATPTPTPSETPTGTPTPTPTRSHTGTPTETPSPTRSETPTTTDESTTSGSGPGFGPVAALAALGVGAWRVVRDGERRRED